MKGGPELGVGVAAWELHNAGEEEGDVPLWNVKM